MIPYIVHEMRMYKAYQREYRKQNLERLKRNRTEYSKTEKGKEIQKRATRKWREANLERINALRRELYKLKTLKN